MELHGLVLQMLFLDGAYCFVLNFNILIELINNEWIINVLCFIMDYILNCLITPWKNEHNHMQLRVRLVVMMIMTYL